MWTKFIEKSTQLTPAIGLRAPLITQFADFFSSKEIVIYKDLNDLVFKIYKFLKNDKLRKITAKNGRNKYFKYFNSTIVADFIINRTYKTSKKFYWETKIK